MHNTLFTRSSWLDELARRAGYMLAARASSMFARRLLNVCLMFAMLYACFIFAQCLLNVCWTFARRLLDVCSMFARSCERGIKHSLHETIIKQTSSKRQANIKQLEHTSCTRILNAFAGCLLDNCSMIA